MLEKTSGIVLHQIKYSDSGTIVNIYTRKFGRLALMVKGSARKKKTGGRPVFQPMTILDLVVYYRDSRSIQTLKEYSCALAPVSIYGNIVKSSMAIFLGEMLSYVLREEVAQEDLFNYINNSIIYLESRKSGFSNFHIAFLAGLCSYLGIEPELRKSTDNAIFDLINGRFITALPAHGNYASAEVSGILADFFSSSWDNMNSIELNGAMRNEVLAALVKYYSIHLPSLKKIKSLEVFREVFS
jgi:DNA repair protein RecO (recombination protein O)